MYLPYLLIFWNGFERWFNNFSFQIPHFYTFLRFLQVLRDTLFARAFVLFFVLPLLLVLSFASRSTTKFALPSVVSPLLFGVWLVFFFSVCFPPGFCSFGLLRGFCPCGHVFHCFLAVACFVVNNGCPRAFKLRARAKIPTSNSVCSPYPNPIMFWRICTMYMH